MGSNATISVDVFFSSFDVPPVAISADLCDISGAPDILLRLKGAGIHGLSIWLSAGQSQEIRAALEEAERKLAAREAEAQEEACRATADMAETGADRCPPRE